MSELAQKIRFYYDKRGLTKPTAWQALGFLNTELGEVYDVLLNMEGSWVRNNPQNHTAKTYEELEEELGDVIMMAMVAGLANGLDPIEALMKKMDRKLGVANITVSMQPSSPEEFEND